MNKDISLTEIIDRSVKIRNRYHELEIANHHEKWTVQEDALAFLSDAGLVGRLTMAHTGKWVHNSDPKKELEHKLGECIWWISILANELDIDLVEAIESFLSKTEKI